MGGYLTLAMVAKKCPWQQEAIYFAQAWIWIWGVQHNATPFSSPPARSSSPDFSPFITSWTVCVMSPARLFANASNARTGPSITIALQVVVVSNKGINLTTQTFRPFKKLNLTAQFPRLQTLTKQAFTSQKSCEHENPSSVQWGSSILTL